ncbi:ATP-binding protein [uncultured Herbaspirillum sp.]|uniref:ATP-binding protein n=1 Tax=uncultured Herbaspirillum sp. TaxID=160236 RepID=UPI0026089B8B|nr:ATP-binding protein [uncultured Herbaspirillum sp.]
MKFLPSEPQVAAYIDTGTRRYKGNPFIEALPPMPATKLDFSVIISEFPQAPTASDRKLGEIVRLTELETLGDVIYPFEGYAKAALAVSGMMRESYKSRNPVEILDVKRRHALAIAGDAEGIYIPSGWVSTAKSHLLIANSGIGKSTFARKFLGGYPQLIQHQEYQGKPLKHLQLVYIQLRVPNDGSLKGLCLQFFHEIDRLLGTNYLKEARVVGTISAMTLLMQKVASAVSLSMIVIDEFQNLRSATGRQAEHVKNLIAELIEWTGVSVLIISTPAIDKVIEGNLGNARKMTTLGETAIGSMQKDGETWKQFCETLWDYTYVRQKVALSDKTRNAWYEASAGNTAFAKLAFMLAQRSEIGGRERIDASSFDAVANTDLLFLRPAIRSLLSNKASALVEFNDLFISRKYKELRSLFGIKNEKSRTFGSAEEFEELEDRPAKVAKKKPEGRKVASYPDFDLPEEDPLLFDS